MATVGMAVVMSASAAPASMVGSHNQALVALAQQPAALRKGDVAVDLLPVTQPMHIVVALKLRNQVQLDSFVAKTQRRGTMTAQRSMSADDFVTQFAPTQAQAQSVVDYLAKTGFTNIQIAPNRQLVSGDATADSVRAAFHAGLVQVRTHDGRNAYANTGAVMVPASLRDTVLSVLGLQTVNVFHTTGQAAGLSSTVHTSSVPGFSGLDPTDFAKIYGASGTSTAVAVPVGIISEGSMTATLSDLAVFATSHHLPAVAAQVAGNGSADTSGDVEWDLDSQDIVGMSGGVKELIFYDATSLNNSDIITAINAAVSANAAKIIDISLHECERDANADGMVAAADQILQQAVAQGQTFSASAGDRGSEECTGASTTTVSYPASSPYVVAVGGTRLNNTDGTYYPGESVWEDDPTRSGGGGPSEIEPIPSWQVGVGQYINRTTRGVPDVAFDASPYTGAVITYHGQLAQYGGTSLSAPLFAGAWARVLAAKGAGFGFAAPRLYDLPPDAFHDVTTGQNIDEQAQLGWDYASGFGSLNISQAIQDFNTPVANFSYVIKGQTVNFTDTSIDWDSTLSRHAWTFGDGATSTAVNPSHTYAPMNYYAVTETVTDAITGKTSAKTVEIYIQAPPPVADFIYFDDGGLAPGTIEFVDKSSDLTGFSDDEIDWYFGDGWHGGNVGLHTSVLHTYATGGTYMVTEVVHNWTTGDGSITKSVLVPPTTAPGLSMPASSDGGYTVGWTPVPSATRYVLQQRFNGSAWTTVASSSAMSWFSITALGPHASGNYGYQVQACNAGGCGPWSPVATITVTLGTEMPAPAMAPVASLPAMSSSGNYTVTWTAVSGASRYDLQQLGAAGRWVSAAHLVSNSLVVRGKRSGTYGYRARACNAAGCGPWSDSGTITVSLP
ncbi:MAG TPA: protease pro-enzyme activation domain-containing protein [Rhodanobacter sp.]